MKTYQDLLEVGENEFDRMDFIQTAIEQHKASKLYRNARDADAYNKHRNVTIEKYQKVLYTMTGKAVPDVWSANFKLASRFFNRFITQENQHLMGNGVTWEEATTAERLGDDFNAKLQYAGEAALWGGVSFGFFNLDHLEVFTVLEFVPLYDEENGAMMAGIRWWQVDEKKPLRATLYEIDGYTSYICIDSEWSVRKDKRPYIINIASTEADGDMIYDGENYPTLPIVPLWGNPQHQSELVGLREQIDCYDLIKSGFANTVDEASIFYWTINNAGGMDDVDLAKFVEHMKTVHAASVDENGATAEAHTMDAPHESRSALLDRLRSDLYEDAMAVDTKQISAGNVTATQILAAYEPMTSKVDRYEECVKEFLRDILRLAGIEDAPTFSRSYIVNKTEEIQTVLQAGEYLPDDYVTRKILTLLGDSDKADDILDEIRLEDESRLDDEEYEDSQNEDGFGNPQDAT